MADPQKPNSWWQTLPGVLTALAAAVTAVSGLLALLFQHGVLGGKAASGAGDQPAVQAAPAGTGNAAPAATPNASATAGTSAAGQTASAAAPESAQVPAPVPAAPAASTARPWPQAEAVLLARDGTTTRVRADSLSSCISVNHQLDLDSGQSIPFEKLKGIDVLQADEPTASNAKARLKLTLADGTELSATADARCDLIGHNGLGRFSIYFDRLRSVRFE